jgi:hypothetical protein
LVLSQKKRVSYTGSGHCLVRMIEGTVRQNARYSACGCKKMIPTQIIPVSITWK